MKITARCPASCGELIQGIIKGKEMLISYPVNLYSEIVLIIGKGIGKKEGFPKVFEALKQLLNEFNEKTLTINDIKVDIKSQIPVGKGMASSTADIAAAIKALLAVLDIPGDERLIAKIAVKIEPTDSTVFKKLTLFDHLNGTYIEELADVPQFDVMVLEGIGRIDTVSYRKDPLYIERVYSRESAFNKIIEALNKKVLSLIGEAAEESARLNHKMHEKPYLESLIELVQCYNGIGVNIAHSGTVCGVMYNSSTDIEKIEYMIKNNFNKYFYKIHHLKSVEGGSELMDVKKG